MKPIFQRLPSLFHSIAQHPPSITRYLELGVLLGSVGYLIGAITLASVYHGLPDVQTSARHVRDIPMGPGMREALLAQAGCQPATLEKNPWRIYQAVFLHRPAGCHLLSLQFGTDWFTVQRHRSPSALEEALMAVRIENELPADTIFTGYLTARQADDSTSPLYPLPQGPLEDTTRNGPSHAAFQDKLDWLLSSATLSPADYHALEAQVDPAADFVFDWTVAASAPPSSVPARQSITTQTLKPPPPSPAVAQVSEAATRNALAARPIKTSAAPAYPPSALNPSASSQTSVNSPRFNGPAFGSPSIASPLMASPVWGLLRASIHAAPFNAPAVYLATIRPSVRIHHAQGTHRSKPIARPNQSGNSDDSLAWNGERETVDAGPIVSPWKTRATQFIQSSRWHKVKRVKTWFKHSWEKIRDQF